MSTQPGAGGSELVRAVHELTRVVEALRDTVMNDYPRRAEIEEKYATKYGIKRRRAQILTGTLLAIVLSYFASVQTVSYCFLTGNPEKDPKTFCRIIPGYSERRAANRVVLKVFEDITNTTRANKARIDVLEKQIQELQKKQP